MKKAFYTACGVVCILGGALYTTTGVLTLIGLFRPEE